MVLRDWGTMIRKEILESFGHRRFLMVFGLAALLTGVLPTLSLSHAHAHALGGDLVLFRALYVLLAAVIVVAQTAPDLVLHERVGHTLDYLLTTRLSDTAIFGAKLAVAAGGGDAAAPLAAAG